MSGDLRNRERLSITLERPLARRVRRVAKLGNETISALIERLVTQNLEHAEQRAQASRDPLIERLAEALASPGVLERAARILSEEGNDAPAGSRLEGLLNRPIEAGKHGGR